MTGSSPATPWRGPRRCPDPSAACPARAGQVFRLLFPSGKQSDPGTTRRAVGVSGGVWQSIHAGPRARRVVPRCPRRASCRRSPPAGDDFATFAVDNGTLSTAIRRYISMKGPGGTSVWPTSTTPRVATRRPSYAATTPSSCATPNATRKPTLWRVKPSSSGLAHSALVLRARRSRTESGSDSSRRRS